MSFDDELVGSFVSESREHLQTLVPDLVLLEKQKGDAHPELVNRIFRSLHSIKGSSGFFEFSNVKRLSHALEDLLGRVRENELPVTPELMDVLLAGTDKLSALIEDIAASDGVDIEAEMQRADALVSAAGTPGGGPPSEAPPAVPVAAPAAAPLDPDLVLRAKRHGLRLYRITLAPSSRSLEDLLARIGRIGELVDRQDRAAGTELRCLTVLSLDLLAEALALPMALLRSEPLVADPAPAPTPAALPAAPGPKAKAESVRIGTEPLSRLLELAGELVLSRNQAMTLLGGRGGIPGLQGVLQKLDLVTTEMQDRITRLRIESMEQLFAKVPRLVRDVSRQLSKEIDLELVGSEVELDRSILEQLSDPLTHLVRNAADHGLESPAARKAAGKPERGRLTVRAFHEGGQVILEVTDDGRGIDPGLVQRKAIEKGLITPAEAAKLEEAEVLRLVLAAGFSTATEVSEISGRGVGMNVVATNVERLGGSVSLRSKVGRGTTIRLRLPLTLAIIPALVVGVREAFRRKDGRLGEREHRFAIPQACLREILRVRAAETVEKFERIQGAAVLRLRDELLPLARLPDVLGLKRPYLDPVSGEVRVERRKNIADRRIDPDRLKKDRRNHVPPQNVLTLQAGDDRFALIVDHLYDHQEIVVKPLSSYAKEARCYAGATILGDGEVAMIVDAPGLAVLAGLRSSQLRGEEQRRRQARAKALSSMRTRETVLLFAHAPHEQLAIPLGSLARIQKLDLGQLEVVGGVSFVQCNGRSVRVVKLSDHLPLAPMDPNERSAVLLLPKGQPQGKPPIGFLASRVLDTEELVGELDTASVQAPGVRGAAPIRGKLTLLLDLEVLLWDGTNGDIPDPRPA